jgi:hypothetical protein
MTMNKYLYPLLVNALKKLLGIRSPSAMFEVDAETINAVIAENDLHEKLAPSAMRKAPCYFYARYGRMRPKRAQYQSTCGLNKAGGNKSERRLKTLSC